MNEASRPDAISVYRKALAVRDVARKRGQFAPAEAAAHVEELAAAVMDLAILAGAEPQAE